jgi:FdhD protein
MGHLITEGVIAGPQDVGAIGFCPEGGAALNVVQVSLVPPSLAAALPPHRRVFSSCALCGSEQIEQAARDLRTFAPHPRTLTPAGVTALAERMGLGQVLFPATGASHAAAVTMRPLNEYTLTRAIVREDIGRHNALDKAVGAALAAGLDLRQTVLCLSSRLSFEMVAKAARAGIADVIGLSAPTAMAVALARRLGMFLAGFVRGGTFTVYSGIDVLLTQEPIAMSAETPVTIWIVDPSGQTAPRCREALARKGWALKQAASLNEVHPPAGAVVLVGELPTVELIRRHPDLGATPVVLLENLDRSGWDRTFADETAFQVDAMLDMPVDAEALADRLEGILSARHAVRAEAPPTAFRDIIRRAIDNEEAAERFYRQAAAASTDPATKAVLEDLAGEEREHKQSLLDFLEGRRPISVGETAPGSVVETFGTPEFTSDLKPADAFLLAARKEKLAAEFYANWAQLCPPGPERDLLLTLADVERRHKRRVEDLFTNASFPETFYE